MVVRFGDRLVLDGITFDVQAGELLCVLGPSGAGKTTLLRALGGLVPLASGSVLVGGEPAERGWPRTAYVFQSPRLVPWRTVLANVELAQELRSGRADRARAERYLELCGIAEHRSGYPAVLSGGERQRVALARALAVEPEVIFMDEPFSALDAATRARLREELRAIWRRERRTIVFVTHDVAEAESLATRILELSARPARVTAIRPARPQG
ncbi:MAG TPA: ATP-binding cassette domain-containing protein [Candidatus Limnocylindria bacterium]|nr:ATP-binding cassette domain-containing protein [Candidatus Limnocylindria bacterium]